MLNYLDRKKKAFKIVTKCLIGKYSFSNNFVAFLNNLTFNTIANYQ